MLNPRQFPDLMRLKRNNAFYDIAIIGFDLAAVAAALCECLAGNRMEAERRRSIESCLRGAPTSRRSLENSIQPVPVT